MDISNIKVSIIVPTYERFDSLLVTVGSIEAQTHQNIEIIVVNDGSTDPRYYTHTFGPKVKLININKNSRYKVGVANPGVYARNIGLDLVTGEYIGFCDDDDCWLPHKLELQLKEMRETGCLMCCTEGYYGAGTFLQSKRYPKYNSQTCNAYLKDKFNKAGYIEETSGAIFKPPKILDKRFFTVHNCAIACSVLLHASICKKVGYVNYGGYRHPPPENRIVRKGAEDYDYWLSALNYTNCVYIDIPCVYYDADHGGGKKYL